MKKLLKNMFTISAICLAIVACGKQEETKQEATQATETTQGQSVGMPNPFIEAKNLDEASKLAGFTLSVPESYEDYKKIVIQAIENDMIEVIYFNDTDNEGLRIRKAKGTDDISGDYNEYKEENVVKIGDVEVTEKGSDGDIAVVTWNDGTYSYAIDASEAKLNAEAVTNLVSNIK